VVDSKCRWDEKAEHFKFGTCTFPFHVTSRHSSQLMKNQSPKEHGPRSALCNSFLNVGAPCIFWNAKQFTLPLIRNLLICDSYVGLYKLSYFNNAAENINAVDNNHAIGGLMFRLLLSSIKKRLE